MRRTAQLLAGMVFLFGTQIPGFSTSAEVPIFPESELKQDPDFDEATYQKLQDIQVDVSWNKTYLLAALGELTDETQKADPAHGRIEFRLTVSDPGESAGMRKVSVVLMGVPVFAVLQYLSQQTNFQIQVHKGCVLIRPVK